ncbi:tol-pal system protein YbgF [uncultured Desulfobacter sp.]|uniref:tol-pal system protein YbgF n=1 Tax=uncultured Desulfobacter sp. TaxID=240139 RepID=UPI002AAB734D|nr:tol-pal system protein YbgF [uncultured Desulfobacter sp.]
MLASPKKFLRIALLLSLLFFTASCGTMTKQKFTAGQARDTNVTVPDSTPAPMDTSLDQEIRTRHLEEKITRLENRMTRLEQKLSSQTKPWPPPAKEHPTPPARPDSRPSMTQPRDLDPVKFYNQGRTLLLERNIIKAQELFSDFVKKFPDHDLADNALYWLGECSYTTGDYIKAAQIFTALVQTYPKGLKVPDALLKTGYAYLSVDDVQKANEYFKQVITRYPFSPAAEKAQQKLSQTR